MEIIEIIKYLDDLNKAESKKEMIRVFDAVYEEFLNTCTLPKRKSYIEALDEIEEAVRRIDFFTWDESEALKIQAENFEKLIETIIKENKKIFIVHGRDKAMRNDVTSFLGMLKQDFTILEYSVNGGRTMLEKFIKEAEECQYAIVLFSAEDEGRYKNEQSFMQRARQNVIMELGFFLGYLDRHNIFILHEDTQIELPSDFHGISYETYDKNGAWRTRLVKELKASGQYIPEKWL